MRINHTTSPQKTASIWLDCLFLTLALGSLFFLFVGSRPLFVPDEGRYAEISREMAALHDYVTPYLNGIKYFEKPPLFYWLGTAAIKIGGLNLWSLRAINACLGLIGCLLTYLTARKLYDRGTGILAALVLGTSVLYFVMAHMISLDLPVTVFLMASLYGFILACQTEGGARRWFMWGTAIAAALAVLTKGLIGIVFPGVIIVAWLTLTGNWRILSKLFLPSSILIFLLLALPWHILVAQRNPEFFYFYFIEQHFLRYTSPNVGHYQPAWFFIPNLILGFFPWIVFLPQAFAAQLPRHFASRKKYATELFLMLWALIIFIFFSFSKSKLIPYILPIFPPLAILTAHYLRQTLPLKKSWGMRAGYLILFFMALVCAWAFYTFGHSASLANPAQAAYHLNLAGLILVIGTGLSCLFAFQNHLKAIGLLIATTWLFLITMLTALPAIDTRTILPLTNKLIPILQPQDEVVTFNQYYQDLPFYLRRRVSILNWQNELSYGMLHQDTREWMISDFIFWKRWNSKQRLFVVLSLEEYKGLIKKYPKKSFYIIEKTNNTVLMSNQGP